MNKPPTTTTPTAYAEACAAYTAATKIYTAFQVAYRCRKIGDSEFVAARKTYDAATEVFDAAFITARDSFSATPPTTTHEN